ncbi:TssA family type VI secretion system protein [Escherichia coli]|uniref:TssA family type VI secretion system protein n=1 Tax=Escherichia coli TaxID=562 RepID=UPI000B7DA834|nr:TssA family type VI secretion system protein [Escherichia coli]
MSTLNSLLSACQTEQEPLLVATRERVAQWDNWLQPLPGQSSAGEDPGYDDDFQQIREEVNKLSGADTELICRLAEKLLTTTAKDIRVATYYCWAKLHREGEQGLAEGLELLAGLLERFGPQLHPQRDRSRKAALEWLAGSRMTDSLSLYLQQNWAEMLETADSTFSRGANHLWLDLQWYIHQALTKSGKETLADIVAADLKGLLLRLSGLETLAFSDGTPFADEVTLNWIQQSVLDTVGGWGDDTPSAPLTSGNDDILALEPEAVALADSEGPDAALGWLQTRPGMTTDRQKWLLRLLMGRIAEQYGKNELAVHLFAELGERAGELTLKNWEPELLFEVQARHLKLLRLKASRSEADKTRLTSVMDQLLAGLIAVDPARAAVLCG